MNGDTGDTLPLAQQVEILKERLAQAQKLAGLGELLSTVAHDLNNVLMPVINYAQMGLRHKDEPTREKSFTKILQAGQKAARIIATTLGMARGRSNAAREATNLVQVVEDALLLLEREMTNHRVSVERQFENVPEAIVNAGQIQQVLLNLVINARQAMPKGGHLLVRLAYDAAANMVDLTVRDNGSGIEPEKLRRIFDPFFTTKSGPDATGKGGTGVGLSSCREIVEAHQGRIRVESTVGKGTAFTIKLPAVQRAVGAPNVATSASVIGQTSPVK